MVVANFFFKKASSFRPANRESLMFSAILSWEIFTKVRKLKFRKNKTVVEMALIMKWPISTKTNENHKFSLSKCVLMASWEDGQLIKFHYLLNSEANSQNFWKYCQLFPLPGVVLFSVCRRISCQTEGWWRLLFWCWSNRQQARSTSYSRRCRNKPFV